MGNIASAASAFRLSKSYLPSHSTFYNAVSMSLCSFAGAAHMKCAEAKPYTVDEGALEMVVQPI